MKKILRNKYVLLIILVTAIGSGVIDYYTPMMGDDLKFWRILGQENYNLPNRQTLWFFAAHINCCNGRLLDALGPIIINLLPKGMASIVMGCMTGLFFVSVLLCSGISARRDSSAAITLIAVTLAITPWWDYMLIRVCQFNYLWGSTFCLLFIYLFYMNNSNNDSKSKLVGIAVLGILAGSAHEQTGVAMCASFGLWALYHRNYRNLSKRQRYMLTGLAIGTLITFASPGIWNRAGGESVKEEFFNLIVYTLPVYTLFLAVILSCLLSKRGRQFLRKCASSEWLTYTLAGGVAAMIAIISGIPGRTGLFSEICALVALSKMALVWNPRINKATSAVTAIIGSLFIISHYYIAAQTQHKLYRQYNDVIEAYKSSSDGIVFYDTTGRLDVPWLTLYRVKGAPDADDAFLLDCLRASYKPNGNIPVILPDGLTNFRQELTDSIVYHNITIYSTSPTHVVETVDNLNLQYYPGESARYVTHTTIDDGREVWIATPRIRDPGDYNASVKQ